MSTIQLNDGNTMPLLAFGSGTALLNLTGSDEIDRTKVDLIKCAIKTGYRHLDTAEMYGTEREVGMAIKESIEEGVVKREELFVTTKNSWKMTESKNAIEISLKKLGLDYVDLYLLHSPFWTESPSDLQKVWIDMEDIKESGKARSIGVSNYEELHILTTLETARIPPAVNQVEFHPYFSYGNLRNFSRQRANILTTGYGALAPVTHNIPGPLDDTLKALSEKYGVSVGLICLRWCIDQDVAVITTSQKPTRMEEYMTVFDFKLTEEEVNEIREKGALCLKEEYIPRVVRYVEGLKKKAEAAAAAKNKKE
ncbi:NADP-dependent oxidoreductase domain-containing protein [Gymnopilus junonius]|uniref:NADP-dependent oxidoreductase domain-containing protein n=1 Tax=Gymnopilus junonius TaxID=109634 RepID=A0A9P5NT68_GYMJU|nr:NADP-dependent oxidoreductase domain-containing protein [Gymnopilus junonius]